jgi:hypothetical protein
LSSQLTTLTSDLARNLVASTMVVVFDRATGAEIERVTLLRYGGHYRSSSTHTFAVKDAKGKFKVRSERALGLTDDSPFEARIMLDDATVFVDEIDLREAAV